MQGRCIAPKEQTSMGLNPREYLTPGWIYEAYDIVEDVSFLIRDDEDDEIYCRFENCNHATWEILK